MKKTWLGLMLLLFGCGGPSDDSFQKAIDDGWTAFENGDYIVAYISFSKADSITPNSSDALTGKGWSALKKGDLVLAADHLNAATLLQASLADAFAGYAFVLNAQKKYAESNSAADVTLNIESGWEFIHLPSLDAADLHVVRSENFFALGDFANSLKEVKILHPAFDADISKPSGQSLLAAEIEALKTQESL